MSDQATPTRPNGQRRKQKTTPSKKQHSSKAQAQHSDQASYSDGAIPARRSRQQNDYPEQHASLPRPIPDVDGVGDGRPHHQQDSSAMSSVSGHGTATPSKPQVYAGPSFFASPAPSSLPVPRAFSRSVPSTAMQTGPERDDSPVPSTNMTPTRTASGASIAAAPPLREESPLDVFFKAHREEQARKSSGSLPLPASEGTYSRNASGRSNPGPRGGKRNGASTPSRSREMFMMEVDGTDEQSDTDEGPPSSSYHERMKAATSPMPHQNTNEEDSQREAKTQALKRLLFAQTSSHSDDMGDQLNRYAASKASAHPEMPPARQFEARPDGSGSSRYASRSSEPGYHATSRPQPQVLPVGDDASQRRSEQRGEHGRQASDVQLMEENLRRMLKLR